MTIKAQSGFGSIRIFEDFIANEDAVANTSSTANIGPFRLIGETLTDTDAGAVTLESDGLSGVIQLTSPNATDNDSVGLVTSKMFDVAFMAPIVIETRVRFADLDTKEFFFGLTDVNDDNTGIEGKNLHGATTTLTLTASDLCGFFWSAELTEDEMWHGVYNGGTTTGQVVSTSVQLGADAVAGEWDVLRLEVDPNGTARWYLNEVLKQTVTGAVSTTTDLAVALLLEIKGTGTNETVDVDYIDIHANRDWNA